MPELYGKPFKYELRSELNETRAELWNLRKEHRATRNALKYSQSQVEELEAKLAGLKNILGEAIANIDGNIDEAVGERFIKKIRNR